MFEIVSLHVCVMLSCSLHTFTMYVAQDGKEVHGSTTDQASNMKLAFESFEGATCVDHKIQNALKTASKSIFIEKLEKACRSIINQFRRSTKVRISIYRALISFIFSWLLSLPSC